MSSANTAERNARANDFAADYAAASIKILDGATVLADYTLAGFGAASVQGARAAQHRGPGRDLAG